jgi:cephalosporin-C deacetylase-like acetyl esterase
MRLLHFVSIATFLVSSIAVASAQAPSPAANPRSTAPPLVKPDPNSPASTGRTQLYQYLDKIAAQETTSRRASVAAIKTRAEAEARQHKVRRKILDLMGGDFQKTPLNPRILGSSQLEGFRIEKVLFDSQPNFPITALLYLPDNKPAKLPAIVMAPGHAASGKAGDFAMASTLARNGFAVLSYDPIGQGERLQYPDPAHPGQSLATRPTGEHGEAGLQPTLIGDAVARYFAWDGIRAVDYLISRPEIDPERIGAFGCSGGGAMTALLGALDPRVHVVATACYITSFDTLLPALGPQDAEQSIPNFIASGFDFADWVELAAPRPYAIVGTVSDMFPWDGLLTTATEARRFYSLFDPTAEGTPTGQPMPPTPRGPTLNPDTSNTIPATAPFQVITGIGGHGNLRPLTAQIVSFFLVHLAHSDATPILPPPPVPGANPFAAPTGLPAGALQVTLTGQVATSYPGSETIHTLNLKRATEKLPRNPRPLTLAQLQSAIREVTHAEAVPGGPPTEFKGLPFPNFGNDNPARLPAVLLVMSDERVSPGNPTENDFKEHAKAGNFMLGFVPRPSPPGTEETKSPILGPFYLTELRAELVGKTLIGMRVDDVIHAVDYLAARRDIDPNNITVVANGHMGLVALHAAVLDPRIKHVTVDHVLESYRSLLDAPMPLDAPQDILPGVLLRYDIPDLTRVLGPRLTFTDPLPGTANLSTSEPEARAAPSQP